MMAAATLQIPLTNRQLMIAIDDCYEKIILGNIQSNSKFGDATISDTEVSLERSSEVSSETSPELSAEPSIKSFPALPSEISVQP
jgi:hypothetical protein